MLILLQFLFDIAQHQDVIHAIHVIPLKRDPAMYVVGPIFGEWVHLFDAGN